MTVRRPGCRSSTDSTEGAREYLGAILEDVDQTKVDNLIAAATQARASSFVDAAPKGVLDKPELTMTIKSNEGKREEKLTFGRSGSDAYASRAGEPGAAKIEASGLDGIIKALEEIK